MEVMDSDYAMERTVSEANAPGGGGMGRYRWFIMDQWTAVSPGYRLRAWLTPDLAPRLRLTSGFGQGRLLSSGLQSIPLNQYIVPYPNDVNTYFGFAMANPHIKQSAKRAVGIVWGKDLRYLEAQEELLTRITRELNIPLYATVTNAVASHVLFQRTGVENKGQQTQEDYQKMMGEAAFVIGLGDPLGGPTAIQAIAYGATFINPLYEKEISDRAIHSQHDFARDYIGEPYTCGTQLGDWDGVKRCIKLSVDRALGHTPPHKPEFIDDTMQDDDLSFVHPLMRAHNLRERVKRVFPV